MNDSTYLPPESIALRVVDSTQSPFLFIPKGMELQDLIHSYSLSEAAGIFFCGAVSLLGFFILFLYITTKEKIYFHYVIFLFFMLFYGFLHIESTSWFKSYFNSIFANNNRFIEPVTFLAFSFYIFFSIELIEIKKQSRQLYKVLNIFGYSVAAYSIGYFVIFPYLPAYEYEFYVYARIIIYPLCSFFMSWIILKIASPVKYYFIIGSIAYFVGAVVATFRYTIENIPIQGFYYIPAPVYCEAGILIEILCFALALGHRIYYLHRDKQSANNKLIDQLYINEQMVIEMNTQLEVEVRERTKDILETQERLRRQEKKQLKTEYESDMIKTDMLAHRLQVNSHLQFNCLSAIKYLIQIGENRKAENYLVTFSRFLRIMQESSQRRMISLHEEFEILENFIKLEENRFNDNFTYEIIGWDLEEFNEIQIPPLLLQPFVDNAIWHGLLQSSKSNKRLTIEICSLKEEYIKIIIDDNGIGREKANEITKRKMHESMGIHLTEERIKLYNHFYNEIIEYKIIDKKDKNNFASGTRVEVKLKKQIESIANLQDLELIK